MFQQFKLNMRLLPLVASLVTVALISSVSGARILLIAPSMQFSSHRMEVKIVGEELAQHRHEVYITTASLKPQENRIFRPAKSNISELQYHITKSNVNLVKSVEKEIFGNIKTTSKIFLTNRLVQMMCEDATWAVEDKEFIAQAKALMFDYAVVDRFYLGPCFLLIAHVINVPFFSIGSPYDYWLGGTPTMPSVYGLLVPIFLEKNSFSYRLLHQLATLFWDITNAHAVDPADWYYGDLLHKHAPNLDRWSKLVSQSLIFFVSRDFTIDHVQPRMPNVVTVPSLTYAEPSNNLPPELDKIMTSEVANSQGVIVVSFGSMAKYLPADIIDKFAAAFARLSYIVIWNLKGAPYDVTIASNVHIMDWLPQNDLLGHPNTKLFITHCGNNGRYESVYHRVPMVALPMLGDQPSNAYLMEKNGFGKTLNVGSFTSDELVATVNNVLRNPSYREKVAKVQNNSLLHSGNLGRNSS